MASLRGARADYWRAGDDVPPQNNPQIIMQYTPALGLHSFWGMKSKFLRRALVLLFPPFFNMRLALSLDPHMIPIVADQPLLARIERQWTLGKACRARHWVLYMSL